MGIQLDTIVSENGAYCNILGCLDRYFWALEMLNTGNQKIRLRFWLTVQLCSKDGPGKAEAAEHIPQLGSCS